MTAVLLAEGHAVIPGDIIVCTQDAQSEVDENTSVGAGSGAAVRRCLRRTRDADTATSLERRVVATRCGMVHWSEDGQQVSVIASHKAAPLAAQSSSPIVAVPGSPAIEEASAAASSSAIPSILRDAALGAKPGDTVHLRVTRITPTFASGDVIAIRGAWCCNRIGAFAGFRGMLRAEDIKPFKPTKDKLVADVPAESMRPGDVVVATVISQSDAKVYQLSTVAEHCGVVESTVPAAEGPASSSATTDAPEDTSAVKIPSVRPTQQRVALLPVPFKRTIMRHPVTGATYKKWTPLVQ